MMIDRRFPGRLPRAVCCLAAIVGIASILEGCSSRAIPAGGNGAKIADRETWDAFFIQGVRVGYGRTSVGQMTRDGVALVRIEGFNLLSVQRSGQRTQQEMRFSDLETLDGKLVEFESEISMGQVPLRTTGRVKGGQLQMEVVSQGKTVASSIPWSDQYGGLYAMELSLLRQPMEPGQRRVLHGLVAGFNQAATVELRARSYESVSLLSGTYELLRIDTSTQFAEGPPLKGTVWTDRTGETLKSHMDLMDLDSYRVPKAVALESTQGPGLDITTDLSVKLDRPIANAHDSQQRRYRVRLDSGDPASVFVSGPSQRVQDVGPHEAEITVYALRPDLPTPPPPVADPPPSKDDLSPNNLIQSDDPAVVAMAKEAAGEEKDSWKTTLLLEKYVHRVITKKDFSQAFATAAEVAQSREGDCTEHAVFLAAMARARGIPARVAIGLVYVGAGPVFAYHMWTEVYTGDRWTAVDATLARGGIGAAHLKLAHSNLKGAAAYTSFLPVVQVIGHLKVEVLGE